MTKAVRCVVCGAIKAPRMVETFPSIAGTALPRTAPATTRRHTLTAAGPARTSAVPAVTKGDRSDPRPDDRARRLRDALSLYL